MPPRFVIGIWDPVFAAGEQFICRHRNPDEWAFTPHATLAFRFESPDQALSVAQETRGVITGRLLGSIIAIHIYEVF